MFRNALAYFRQGRQICGFRRVLRNLSKDEELRRVGRLRRLLRGPQGLRQEPGVHLIKLFTAGIYVFLK